MFRTGDGVDLRSRNDRRFARYFPEIVNNACSLPDVVLDGELLACRGGTVDSASPTLRLHPSATRVRQLAVGTPAVFIAFDLLAHRDEVLLDRPWFERMRDAYLRHLAGAPHG